MANFGEPSHTPCLTGSSPSGSNVKKLVGVSYEQVDGEDEPDLNQLTLEYRDKSVRVIYNITTAARKIVESRDYNPRDKLLIFIHGFTDSPDNAGFGNISDSLLRGGECNVLALDGSSLIKWLYLRSTTYVRFMGERLGKVLASMVHHGVDPASIHIIGHSLGAHISGFTGKQFTNLTGARVGRISGLDPAGPCFSHVDDDVRLNSTDADFVDVIHTDAGVYGITDSVGQVDYFPNSGSQQPNCLLQSCSHSRAWLYYAESIVRPEAFPAVRCDDWEAFRRGRCDSEVSHSRAWLYYAESVVRRDAFPAVRCDDWEAFRRGRCEKEVSRAWLYYAESIVRPEAFPAVRCEDWEAFRRGRCEKEVSHSRAWLYYAESVVRPDAFPAVRCDDWEAFRRGRCEKEVSHSRAWLYYAESVARRDAFPAVRCDDWEAFRRGRCDSEVSYMGYPSTPGTRGRYFLQTADEPPYGTGRNGTRYHNNEGIVNNLGGQASNLTKSVEKGAKGFGNQVKNLFG
ncbi:unnamed protein product [Plutella xylostella]|uniref:(diamondback moth) hypothetical protein n=1 Tax=Plutella xylostella TaxID=51655 RepID=A0A8S4FSD4_PLUXY|nr:unnamed protein product [Plutella xylostella]